MRDIYHSHKFEISKIVFLSIYIKFDILPIKFQEKLETDCETITGLYTFKQCLPFLNEFAVIKVQDIADWTVEFANNLDDFQMNIGDFEGEKVTHCFEEICKLKSNGTFKPLFDAYR